MFKVVKKSFQLTFVCIGIFACSFQSMASNTPSVTDTVSAESFSAPSSLSDDNSTHTLIDNPNDLQNLSFVTDYMLSHPTVQKVFLPFITQSAQDTDGEVTFKYYQTNDLYSDAESYIAFEKGKVDFGVLRPGRLDEHMPLSTVIDIPFMAPNAIVGSLLAQDITNKFVEVRDEFPANSEVFALWSSASYQLHSVQPIKHVNELKDKKVAIWQNSLAGIVKELGGIPVLLDTSKTVSTLETGEVDAVLSPFIAITSFGIKDVAKHHLMLNLGVSSFALSCREPIWDQFTPDIQRYFKSIGGAHFSYQIAKTLEEWEYSDMKEMEQAGHIFYELDTKDQENLEDHFTLLQEAWLASMPEEKKVIAEEILAYALERAVFYKNEYQTGVR